MPSMKLSLLALASTAAAVPHYGANPHSKYHNLKPSGNSGYGENQPAPSGKPYPNGGWSGGYNSTAVPYPTGTGYHPGEKTSTGTKTSTSTATVYSTVVVKPTAPGQYEASDVAAKDVPTGQCGPATITVTASEKVTVTVTPGAEVPKSSAAPVEYGATSPAAVYPAETPKAKTSATPAAVYSAETPEAASSKAEYVAPSYAEKPVAYSSAVASPAASASAYPTGGSTYSGTKRGLAYNDAALCPTLGGKFGFGYNWGQVENNDIGTKYVPMMHGPSKSTAEEWLANVDKAVKKGSNAVMGFNECDHAEQCNLSPEAACSAWKTYMNPIKTAHKDVTIVGPSVTNGPAPMGLDWLSRFHDCCPDAIVDATNIHFYDIYEEGQTVERFKAQVEKAAKIYGKPVWITEFGLNPGSASSEQAVDFLKGCMEYMDASPDVQSYSWFMVGTGENQLNTADGGLSAVGQAYAA